MHNIEWCKGGLQLADIDTNNVGENWFKSQNEIFRGKAWHMRENTCTRGVIWYRIVYATIVMYDLTRLSWGFDSISLKCFIRFYTRKEHLKLSILEENNVVLNGKLCCEKTM